MTDAIDRRLGELGEAIDKAREILSDPLIREALADRARAIAAGSAMIRLVAFGLVAQTALLTGRPVLAEILPPTPEPVVTHEPGRHGLH